MPCPMGGQLGFILLQQSGRAVSAVTGVPYGNRTGFVALAAP